MLSPACSLNVKSSARRYEEISLPIPKVQEQPQGLVAGYALFTHRAKPLMHGFRLLKILFVFLLDATYPAELVIDLDVGNKIIYDLICVMACPFNK